MKRSSTLTCLALLLLALAGSLAPEGRGQDPFGRRRDLQWEYLSSGVISLHRAKVPGGWLIVLEQPTRSRVVYTGCTFYPDPKHEWDGGSLP